MKPLLSAMLLSSVVLVGCGDNLTAPKTPVCSTRVEYLQPVTQCSPIGLCKIVDPGPPSNVQVCQ